MHLVETTIGYIVIFGLVIVFTAFYLFRSEKQILLPISQQTYPELLITVLVKKEKRKISTLILQLKPVKENLMLRSIELELTGKNHEKKRLDLTSLFPNDKNRQHPPGEKFLLSMALTELLALMEQSKFAFENFRLVAKTPEGKIYKTHLLAYHPRWGLYKSDSGKYN